MHFWIMDVSSCSHQPFSQNQWIFTRRFLSILLSLFFFFISHGIYAFILIIIFLWRFKMRGRGGGIGNRELQTPTAFSSTYSVLFLLTNITLCWEFLLYFPRSLPPRDFRVSVLGFPVSCKFLALLTFLPGSRTKWLTFTELYNRGLSLLWIPASYYVYLLCGSHKHIAQTLLFRLYIYHVEFCLYHMTTFR